uniref:SAWADEE domain-containing protein n=1 Tax=Chenopodium quinoa TaxID=63459 RepID=A0A803N9Z1_CHEQI
MADATIADTSQVQLEVKRKIDGSWHPCQVSLCSGGGLSVKYEGQVSEDVILDVEDARVCLRVRSIPVQGDDCCCIEEGRHVVAACERNYQRLFFDAVVQKAIRVRHSKRASCRCTFMIKWLSEHTENGVSSIPSSSIMNLATESIDSHPVVAAFLNSTEEKSHLSTSSASPSTFEDTESEFDFHGLLKHIEGIGSMTDGESNGRTKLVVSQRENKCVQVSCGRRQLRSARRQDITQSTIDNLITSAPSSHEKSVQNQSPLSPLAARAVLASLVSKLPQKIESVLHEERKCDSVLDFSSCVYNSRDSDTFIINKRETLVTNETRFSDKMLHAKLSNGLPIERSNKIEPSIDSDGSSSSLMREESAVPVVARRLTRSAMNRESANTDEDNGTTSAKDATFVRVTRSTAHKEKGNMAKKDTEDLQDRKIRSTRSICSAVKKETEILGVRNRNRTLDEGAKGTILSSTIRVTRSTARAGTGHSGVLDDCAEEPLQDKHESESVHTDHSNVGSEAMISTQKRTFPLINAELKSAESNKKQKGSNSVEKRQKTAGSCFYSINCLLFFILLSLYTGSVFPHGH